MSNNMNAQDHLDQQMKAGIMATASANASMGNRGSRQASSSQPWPLGQAGAGAPKETAAAAQGEETMEDKGVNAVDNCISWCIDPDYITGGPPTEADEGDEEDSLPSDDEEFNAKLKEIEGSGEAKKKSKGLSGFLWGASKSAKKGKEDPNLPRSIEVEKPYEFTNMRVSATSSDDSVGGPLPLVQQQHALLPDDPAAASGGDINLRDSSGLDSALDSAGLSSHLPMTLLNTVEISQEDPMQVVTDDDTDDEDDVGPKPFVPATPAAASTDVSKASSNKSKGSKASSARSKASKVSVGARSKASAAKSSSSRTTKASGSGFALGGKKMSKKAKKAAAATAVGVNEFELPTATTGKSGAAAASNSQILMELNDSLENAEEAKQEEQANKSTPWSYWNIFSTAPPAAAIAAGVAKSQAMEKDTVVTKLPEKTESGLTIVGLNRIASTAKSVTPSVDKDIETPYHLQDKTLSIPKTEDLENEDFEWTPEDHFDTVPKSMDDDDTDDDDEESPSADENIEVDGLALKTLPNQSRFSRWRLRCSLALLLLMVAAILGGVFGARRVSEQRSASSESITVVKNAKKPGKEEPVPTPSEKKNPSPPSPKATPSPVRSPVEADDTPYPTKEDTPEPTEAEETPEPTPPKTSPPTEYPVEIASFAATGDAPYTAEQSEILAQQIRDVRGVEFLVHVGDLRDAFDGNRCRLSEYQEAAEILALSPVPVFVLLGDNDWNDCPNKDEALGFWEETFWKFESQHWSHDFQIIRQPGREFNFAFVHKNILFMGLNIVGGDPYDEEEEQEWGIRLREESAWAISVIEDYDLDQGDRTGRVVMFGHADPRPSHAAFFDPLYQFVEDKLQNRLPMLYVNGDAHRWKYNTWFFNQRSWLRITLPGEASEDITRIFVVSNGEDQDVELAFQFDRGN